MTTDKALIFSYYMLDMHKEYSPRGLPLEENPDSRKCSENN